MSGYGFTILSAVCLAWTVIFDKLVIAGDCYDNNKNAPWFMSSFMGMALGLISTAIAWGFHGNITSLATLSISLLNIGVPVYGINIPYAALMFLGGVAVTLTQRSYFRSFDDVAAGMIAMIIAVTPVAIFALSVVLDGDRLGTTEIASLAITVAALIGYEAAAYKKGEFKNRYRNLALFLVFSTIYVVTVDRSLAGVSEQVSVESALVALPYYWLGFGVGSLTIFMKEVRAFLASLLSQKKKFIKYILLMEVVGMSFYFFEVFGLEELSATLAALIVGAHVVVVWVFDIYLNRKHSDASSKKEGEVKILFAVLQTEDVEILSYKTIMIQGICIILALAGIALWPS